MSKIIINDGLTGADWRHDSHSVEKYRFIHHFLPHPESTKRATLLNTKSLFLYCVLIVLITGLFRIIPAIFPNILGYATNINVSDLLKDTNKRRAEAGLDKLLISSVLSSAAQKKAEHMFKNNYWAHVAPDGTEPWDFILGANYDYIYAGENLAKNFSSSEDVVKAWLESPSHRENLLNRNYTEIGFAVMNGELNGNETTLVVQMFGKPRTPTQIAVADAPDEDNSQSIATKPDIILEDIPNEVNVNSPNPINSSTQTDGNVKPLMDVRVASRWVTVLFGGFVATLLALDMWYSNKKGNIKITGHTIVHLSFLIIALVGIWFVLTPGSIL